MLEIVFQIFHKQKFLLVPFSDWGKTFRSNLIRVRDSVNDHVSDTFRNSSPDALRAIQVLVTDFAVEISFILVSNA